MYLYCTKLAPVFKTNDVPRTERVVMQYFCVRIGERLGPAGQRPLHSVFVGDRGLEPLTFRTSSERSNQLS